MEQPRESHVCHIKPVEASYLTTESFIIVGNIICWCGMLHYHISRHMQFVND